MPAIELTDLFPSTSYRLAYALPLLVLSTLLAFAGSFFTLDRTRSFRPRSDPLHVPGSFSLTKNPRRFRLYLQGGVGGIAIGYSFGLHLSTFLALVFPNESSSPPLSPKSFLVVWVITSVSLATFSGLFKYAALALAGITGGTSLALALSITIHPNLLTRRIFLALLAAICCVFVLLPFSRTQRNFIRLSASATGAFGLILSIALLAHAQQWSNVWERLWVTDGNGWGDGVERALSAGYWLILVAGCLVDWVLRRYFGGNPDESMQEWDSYLTEYATSLPMARDRAGIFQPVSYSSWDRFLPCLRRSKPSNAPDILFPPDDKYTLSPHMSFEHNRQGFSPGRPTVQQTFSFDEPPRLLRKQTQRPLARLRGLASAESHGYRKREALKFGAMDPGDLSSDDEGDPLSSPPPPARRASTRSSSATLTNGSSEGSRRISLGKESLEKVAAAKRVALEANDASAPEYSDHEEDPINSKTQTTDHRSSPGWKPPFIVRNGSNTASTAEPVAAVPMTPSLIRAVDRIEAAKVQAYGSPTPLDSSATATTPDTPTAGTDPARKQRWEAFWHDVTSKAGQKTHTR
ncbi:hypothetical protein H4582DRAFT_1843952 [Lactarius indigo]|nr:hypothetical protein H4582DRAFT_1843952 [Lactarius indigo]